MGEIDVRQALKDTSNSKNNGMNVTVYMAVKGVWDGENTVELTGEMTECVDVRDRQYCPVAFAEWGKNQRINGLSDVVLEFPAVSERATK